MESGHDEELAEEEETLIGGTGVEETVDEEIEELAVTEAKLDVVNEDSVVDLRLQLSRSIHEQSAFQSAGNNNVNGH